MGSNQRIDLPPELLEASRAGRIVPFVGSGLSSAVVDANGERLPSYSELLERLARRLLSEHSASRIASMLSRRRYKDAATLLRDDSDSPAFIRELQEIFRVVRPSPAMHHVILDLHRFPLVLTTNYDRILDLVLRPRPEVLSNRDVAQVRSALDEGLLNGGAGVPIVVKLNGDIVAPATIALGRSESMGLFQDGGPVESLLLDLMERGSILFLGYSFSDPDYRGMIIRAASRTRAVHPNFAVIDKRSWAALQAEERRELITRARLRVVAYESDGGHNHQFLWEALSLIPRRHQAERRARGMRGAFFRPEERADYLRAQLDFERGAAVLRYNTQGLTNAIGTEAYIERVCRPKMEDFARRYFGDMHTKEWVQEVVDLMHERRCCLKERVNAGVEVRIISSVEGILAEQSLSVERFQALAQWTVDKALNVSFRVVRREGAEERTIRSYASLLRVDGSNVETAIAYATQATQGRFATHVFEENTQYASDRLVEFEADWARAASGLLLLEGKR